MWINTWVIRMRIGLYCRMKYRRMDLIALDFLLNLQFFDGKFEYNRTPGSPCLFLLVQSILDL